MTLDFNKIYVIQSLDPTNDDLTGTELFNDVISRFKLKYPNIDAELINVDDRDELFAVFDKIKDECSAANPVKPIIHFEIHGSGIDRGDRTIGTGFALNKGAVEWADLYPKFAEINRASKWGLFITMAVCFGNYAMMMLLPTLPAPFTGILGSFDSIDVGDLQIRYDAFYQELLTSLDLEKAIDALKGSNPGLPADYRLIDAEATFKNVYQKYYDEGFSETKIKQRFDDGAKEIELNRNDRNKMHKYRTQFKAKLLRTKQDYLEKAKTIYFMFDKFPENRSKFCVNWKPAE